ncbi:MAG TPA: S9 family peptidase [Rhizomicrobium sp.]|jgi:dipeptidyl aminopeptidase/acylaminoacyl peptidase|nr:S9 family peptidase [Rhizomicrobium sp.]
MLSIVRAFGAPLIALALLPFLPASAPAAPPPVEAFGDLPHAERAWLSPDGKQLAVLRPYDGRKKVAFYDLTKTGAEPQVVGMQGAIAGSVHWKSNDTAIVVFHANIVPKGTHDPHASSRAIAVNTTKHMSTLMMYNAPYFKANYGGGSIVDMDADDPDHVYMEEVDKRDIEFVLDLYSVQVSTGVATMVLHGQPNTIEFYTDGYGHVIGRLDQDWDNLTNHVIIHGDDVHTYKVKGASDFTIMGVSSSGQTVVERPSATGTTGLYEWTAKGGFGQALFDDPNYDLDSVIHDERNGRIIGVTYIDDMPRTKYFDPAMQRVQTAMEKAFPGQSVTLQSWDTAGTTYVVGAEGPKNPPVLYLYTPADHHVNVIEESYPTIKSADLGEMKPYPYKARDGLDIHAYLTLPPGKDPHNLPTVIFPHGGPESRDMMGFDWWVHYMASRGYAVLQPNFRGSSGYGWNFVTSGDGEWEGKVQYDVQDGVKKLIADGIADPKRICIVGASYGGYMALAGATFSPDLYNCAVSFAGIADLNAMLEEGTTFQSENASIWRRRIGADKNSDRLDSASPARFADKVNIPVLLVHSEKDATVSIKQSRIEEKALKRAGKTVEFVTLDGDDHYLEFPASRTQLLKETDRFLAAHIGN